MTIHLFLQTHPVALIATLFLLGLIIGSFLNVVIYRLPIMMEHDWRVQCCELLNIPNKVDNQLLGLIKPRSHCPHCKHLIRAWENIPVFSYLVLKGKCSACNKPISPRYPFIELLTGILTAIIAWRFGYGMQTLFAIFLTWALICLSMIDIERQLLPDDITLPFLWLGLACNLFFGLFTNIYSSLLGAMLGYGTLWFVFKFFKLITGKEGMGYGDFKLLALFGAWLGWEMLPFIVLASSVAGAIVGVSLIVFHSRDKNLPIPFGPYIAVAGWIALVWGDVIMHSYLRWAIPV